MYYPSLRSRLSLHEPWSIFPSGNFQLELVCDMVLMINWMMMVLHLLVRMLS
ncbi:hypothetical protein RchiOBHm_Chr5g0079761 [Rosa chinensis]|uniref:Uncharacterized protein n=1 Tax=Rosa chinensis TaxID=74649 RepID=A0A2P6QMJ5_ROSCH|nr:hypothetical protein RchiOBHm_Chr5g0079761 [Rosa chinensis]